MPYADPERRKTHAAEYHRRNKQKHAEYSRSWRHANRERIRKRWRAWDRKKRRSLTKEELAALREAAQNDPRVAITSSDIVCLHCGFRGKKLSPHLPQHGQTTKEYKLEWGYNRWTALQAKETTAKQSQAHRRLGSAKRLRSLHALKLARHSLRKKRAAGTISPRREARLNIGDSQRGRPHALPKKKIPDHTLLIHRWKGKTARTVYYETGLFWPAVARRWRRMGFEGNPVYLMHGEVARGSHIAQLCSDKKRTLDDAARALGTTHEHLRRLVKQDRALSWRLGAKLETMRNSWLDRRSSLLPYERAKMRDKYKKLLGELWAVRSWLKDKLRERGTRNVSFNDVLEVVVLGIRSTFTLLGKYPQFFNWAQKQYGEGPFLRAAWRPGELAFAFLAYDFRVSEKTIERVVAKTTRAS